MDNELEKTNETGSENEQAKAETVDTKSLEARIKALEAENGKLKQSVTNASSDASKWKKQYQEKLSAEEKAKQEQDEATAAMQSELEMLRKERNVAKYTAALSAQDIGMDAEISKAVAEALNAGETDKVFDGIRKFIVAHDKGLRENALRNNPTLKGGASEKTVTKEEFRSMSLSEMMAFKAEHPELYAEYTK